LLTKVTVCCWLDPAVVLKVSALVNQCETPAYTMFVYGPEAFTVAPTVVQVPLMLPMVPDVSCSAMVQDDPGAMFEQLFDATDSVPPAEKLMPESVMLAVPSLRNASVGPASVGQLHQESTCTLFGLVE
jgi:hypothetical protein